MHTLSLFAGIGGFDYALERVGCTLVGQVECDPFCRRVLATRFPFVPSHRDVRTYGSDARRREAAGAASGAGLRPGRGEPLGRGAAVDLLVGGFPCQDLSVAGRRAGLGGDRSALFWEIVRIAQLTRPPWGLFENVPGLLASDSGRDMWTVLNGLRQCWPAVGYRILDSRYFGVAQRRRRVFFVGGPDEARVAEVLALTEGGDGGPEPGGEAGPGAAGATQVGVDLARALGGIGGGQDYGANKGTLIAGALQSHAKRHGHAMTTEQAATDGHLVAHALGAGAGGSKFGSGRGSQEDYVVSDPISAHEGKTYSHEGRNNFRLRNVVSVHEDQRTGQIYENDHTHALAQPGGKPGQGYQAVREGASVRRLTPVECERLQGFPDGWTCLCTPLKAYAADPESAAWRCTCADSPRYRALGNAVTTTVIEWLGRRLLRVG